MISGEPCVVAIEIGQTTVLVIVKQWKAVNDKSEATLAVAAGDLLFTHVYILQSRIRKPMTGGRPYFQQGNP